MTLFISSMKNNYISSMQFFPDDQLFLAPSLNNSAVLRRNIRIRSSKLPPDFFKHPESKRYAPSSSLQRSQAEETVNRTIRTPSFCPRNHKTPPKFPEGSENRKAETARTAPEKRESDDRLILGVLQTSENLRKIVRKQSFNFD